MTEKTSPTVNSFVSQNRGLILSLLALVVLPFIVGLFEGASLGAVWQNESGTSKFVQGLAIEIFILAIYALSYDLIFGITGLLSFGHSMFFAAGAYLSGILLKSFDLSLGMTLVWVLVIAVVNAFLFGIVLPRVKGITFALVTLGLGSVFHIVIMSREVGDYTGADVGLQAVPVPEFINPATHRLTFYFVAIVLLLVVYFIYKRFVDSPTGRVCVAIRENEDRAKMLGFNTFYFKIVALVLSSVTAALAGTLHTLYQPIVSPNTAGLGFTVTALLIILIGGVGTLNGALVGAAVYRLLDFGLRRYLGESASFINGAIYILIVLYLPFGIVGTWRMQSAKITEGRKRLLKLLKLEK
ncbi:MAG: branched-chain amino acid ABC transporter permease [Anaerolineales bacterium]|nr:branched-chain amino acid ABC transporter permease [Anaerolineales bacterium]